MQHPQRIRNGSGSSAEALRRAPGKQHKARLPGKAQEQRGKHIRFREGARCDPDRQYNAGTVRDREEREEGVSKCLYGTLFV